jgi:hypothetical protein
MTHASWPGTPRKPEPRPPEPAAPAGAAWRGIAENLAGLASALLVLGAMLLLIQHVGSVPQ